MGVKGFNFQTENEDVFSQSLYCFYTNNDKLWSGEIHSKDESERKLTPLIQTMVFIFEIGNPLLIIGNTLLPNVLNISLTHFHFSNFQKNYI